MLGVTADARATWLIDPKHSLVEFTARHIMIATVKGRFTSVSGVVRADENDITRSSVYVEIDAASIDTNEPQRDRHLRSADFLDVERYPSLTFQSTDIEQIDPNHLLVRGDLTIRGVTKPVDLHTTINGRGKDPAGLEVAAFSARTEINRRDFGLTWNLTLETGGVLVGDTVVITLELEVIRQGG
jgi:polyisoprenoid-binding protein YceI